jgi:hypothetical protein
MSVYAHANRTPPQVPGYPTWEIKGELYPGEKTLEQLEELTGLREPTPVTEAGDLSPI